MPAASPLVGPAGRLEVIDRRLPGARAAVVLCHSDPLQGGSMYDAVLHRIACALHPRGVSTLRFNYRGVGASAGAFDGGVGEVDDVRAAIEVAARDHHEVAVVGFSFGAWVGLRAAAADDRVTRLVALSPPIGVLDFSAVTVRRPLLVVHGERDAWAALSAVDAWVTGLGPLARIDAVTGADHFFRGRLDVVAAAVVGFLRAGHAAGAVVGALGLLEVVGAERVGLRVAGREGLGADARDERVDLVVGDQGEHAQGLDPGEAIIEAQRVDIGQPLLARDPVGGHVEAQPRAEHLDVGGHAILDRGVDAVDLLAEAIAVAIVEDAVGEPRADRRDHQQGRDQRRSPRAPGLHAAIMPATRRRRGSNCSGS